MVDILFIAVVLVAGKRQCGGRLCAVHINYRGFYQLGIPQIIFRAVVYRPHAFGKVECRRVFHNGRGVNSVIHVFQPGRDIILHGVGAFKRYTPKGVQVEFIVFFYPGAAGRQPPAFWGCGVALHFKSIRGFQVAHIIVGPVFYGMSAFGEL